MGKIIDRTGQKYGEWEVLNFAGLNKHGEAMWLCRCSCGIEKSVVGNSLKCGLSRKCVPCSQKPRDYKERLPDIIWKRILRGASRRNIEFKVNREYCLKLFDSQKEKCALTGLDIAFPKNGSSYLRNEGTASLDRIDNRKGYVRGNIQWVHKDINRMKNIHSEEYFKYLCRLVTEKGEKSA